MRSFVANEEISAYACRHVIRISASAGSASMPVSKDDDYRDMSDVHDRSILNHCHYFNPRSLN